MEVNEMYPVNQQTLLESRLRVLGLAVKTSQHRGPETVCETYRKFADLVGLKDHKETES